MAESHDESAARAFRPNRKPMMIAILANAVLFSTLVLWPYIRGHMRAADARERFAEFAACFWGGEPTEEPGLELPPGERERYEARVLVGPRDWPATCGESLENVAPDEPFLLFPGTKSAEEQVRAAVQIVGEELEALAEARVEGQGPVPHRPYIAVSRLLATLSALHGVVGAQDEMAGDAIVFEGDTDSPIPRPARVPLSAARDATVRWQALPDGLEATATDRRGISYSRAGGGRVDSRRIPRPGLVRGTVMGPRVPWIVWAMPGERCAEDEHRCANHALGLAPYGEGVVRTPEPRWLAGHPLGRIDRTVRVGEEVVTVLAVREEEPAAELRRFPRDPPEEAQEAQEAPTPDVEGEDTGPRPVAAATVVPLEGYAPGDAALLAGGERLRAVWSTRSESRTSFHALDVRAVAESGDEPSAPASVGALDGEHPLLFACEAGATTWLVLGTELGLRVARLWEDAPEPFLGPPVPLGLRDPVADEDPQDDRVRVVCDTTNADIVVLRDGLLEATRCDARARCTGPAPIATGVAGFDAAREDGTTLVAWAGESAAAAVYVRPLGGLAEPTVPAACWQNEQGFCAAPMLRTSDGRFLLATRESTDMRVVQSTDAGESWQTMQGIR